MNKILDSAFTFFILALSVTMIMNVFLDFVTYTDLGAYGASFATAIAFAIISIIYDTFSYVIKKLFRFLFSSKK